MRRFILSNQLSCVGIRLLKFTLVANLLNRPIVWVITTGVGWVHSFMHTIGFQMSGSARVVFAVHSATDSVAEVLRRIHQLLLVQKLECLRRWARMRHLLCTRRYVVSFLRQSHRVERRLFPETRIRIRLLLVSTCDDVVLVNVGRTFIWWWLWARLNFLPNLVFHNSSVLNDLLHI